MEVPSGVLSALTDMIRRGAIEGRGAKGVARESQISGYSLLAEP